MEATRLETQYRDSFIASDHIKYIFKFYMGGISFVMIIDMEHKIRIFIGNSLAYSDCFGRLSILSKEPKVPEVSANAANE